MLELVHGELLSENLCIEGGGFNTTPMGRGGGGISLQ